MDLRHLRYAVAAADHGSFRRAARSLGIDGSVLSRRVQDLEARLGLCLFHRRACGVTLTEAGEWFVPQARKAVDQFEALVSGFEQWRRQSGRYRLRFSIEPCDVDDLSTSAEQAGATPPQGRRADLRVLIDDDSAARLENAVRHDRRGLEALVARIVTEAAAQARVRRLPVEEENRAIP